MARYRGTISGSRDATVSRLGHKNTGLSTTTNGWNIGASAWLRPAEDEEQDRLNISLTGGSSCNSKSISLIQGLTENQVLALLCGKAKYTLTIEDGQSVCKYDEVEK